MIPNDKKLEMTFDTNVINHLGIQMYSTLAPVLAELIANAYDAEANNVTIGLFDDDEKKIVIEDDGHGMSFDDIKDKFLKIGRNRRTNASNNSIEKSLNDVRFVIGRKGIGKLSFFGISKKITIETVKQNILTSFELDWDTLVEQGKQNNGKYEPKLLVIDEKTRINHGTKITLTSITKKSKFVPADLAINLSKYFQIFNEGDFNVKVFYNDKEIENSPISNELKYKQIDIFHKWEFPINDSLVKSDYDFKNEIKGEIYATKDKTISSNMRGISLFSRGKLVNDYSFYDVIATSHGYSYITGWLEIDFIENFDTDVISTNRQSLNWEREDTSKLKDYLQSIIKSFFNEQKEKKKQSKLDEIKNESGIDLDEWLSQLPKHEKNLAKKITDAIINAEGIEQSKSTELIKFTKDSFQFEAFKEMANEIKDLDISDTNHLITLFKEWELIEAREMYKLAIGRVETIKTFEKLIETNAKEVQEIHPFFEKFPWLLDPRINMFNHEVTYKKILEENYAESDLDEKNRRIDFLCTSVSNHKFIIELKRPKHRILLKDIDQAKDYRSFVESTLGTTSPNKVIAYVVGGEINLDDRKTRDEIDSIEKIDKVYVKTYNQLLNDAYNYHKEFIDRYNSIKTSDI